MFGYIKPTRHELRLREDELYKASYCGLCKSMGKCIGNMSRLTLSYDFAFLSLLRMVTDKSKGQVKMRRCMIHPFKKRPILEINPSLEYCAKSSVILTRMKLKDDIKDSRGLKRIKAKIVGSVSVFFKKTDKELLPLEKNVGECIDTLTGLEKENTDSVDACADTFGRLLGAVASFGSGENESRLLYEIGYHLGKWIYVIDACDDFEKDKKSGSFNVIFNAYGENLDTPTRESLKCAMMLELECMSKALELIDFSEYRDAEGIIKNVAYMGLVDETDRVLGLKECCSENNK